MSGRKCSSVSLERNIRQALGTAFEAREALLRAEGLAQALREAAVTTPSLRPLAEEAEKTLRHLREQLRTMEAERPQLATLSLDQITQKQRDIDRLKGSLDEIAEVCRDGRTAAGVRAELAALLAEARNRQSDLGPWLPDLYGDFLTGVQRLLTEVDAAIGSPRTVEAISPRVRDSVKLFQRLRSEVEERRRFHEERLYLAESLKQVCRSELGFAATTAPQRNPGDDLIVEVDTYAFGVIHFRLQLDGTMRTRSEMEKVACPANFQTIERGLRSLGIISQFRYEDDQRPVSISTEENEIPDNLANRHSRGRDR